MARTGKGKVSRAAVWVILALLIIGLAGFGATNFGGSVRSVGSVGDTSIGVDRYARALNDELRALSAQTGEPVSFREAQQFGLDRAVLRRLVSTVALEDEAARIGISVSDRRVGDYLRDIQAFQGLDGSFDRQSYTFALEQAGLTPAEFEEQLRDEIARTLVQGAVSAGAPASDTYVDTIVTHVAEERDVTWITLRPADLQEPVGEPADTEIRAYYEANPEDFTRPETREITYAWVTPDMLVDDLEIDEQELRSLYEERIDEYVRPERRLVERLVFRSEAAAREAMDRIESGETDFEALVEARGLSLDDIDLGDVTREELGDAAEAVFALEEPGVVGPVETSLGPALMRMNAILSAQETPFEEVKDDLRREFAADRARRRISEEIAPIDDLLAAGATLEEVAEETIMDLGRIDWTPDSDAGIAGYEAFRQAAQSVEQDDFPEVRELADGGIFALRLDGIREPELLPLSEVREQAARGWRREATAEALAAQAETVADRIRAGEDMAAAGPAPSVETGLTRDGFVAEVPAGFIDTLFAMEETGALDILRGSDSAVVMRLDAIREPDPDDPELAQRAAAFRARLSQSVGQDLLESFTRAVETRAGIELNQSAINAVHAQFP